MEEQEIRKVAREEVITTLMFLLRMLSDVVINGEDWGKKQEELESFWGRS